MSIPGVTVGLPPTRTQCAPPDDGVGVPGLRPLDAISPSCSFRRAPASVQSLYQRADEVEGITNATEYPKRQIARGRECARVSSVFGIYTRSFTGSFLFRSVPFRFVGSVPFPPVLLLHRAVPFRFVSFRFVSSRFAKFRSIPFRSISSRLVSSRFVPFRSDRSGGTVANFFRRTLYPLIRW